MVDGVWVGNGSMGTHTNNRRGLDLAQCSLFSHSFDLLRPTTQSTHPFLSFILSNGQMVSRVPWRRPKKKKEKKRTEQSVSSPPFYSRTEYFCNGALHGHTNSQKNKQNSVASKPFYVIHWHKAHLHTCTLCQSVSQSVCPFDVAQIVINLFIDK